MKVRFHTTHSLASRFSLLAFRFSLLAARFSLSHTFSRACALPPSARNALAGDVAIDVDVVGGESIAEQAMRDIQTLYANS